MSKEDLSRPLIRDHIRVTNVVRIANRRSQFQKCGCTPRAKLLPPPPGGKQMVDPLDQ